MLARSGLLALALVAAACSWPWWSTLAHWPMTGDPLIWIGEGATSNPGWRTWVFHSEHFSWYRPLAALSFTANEALVGFSPLGFRVFDLALHLACGALCYALLRLLAPGLRPLLAAVAALVFLAHTGSDEVVPFMARRSYSMALALALAGLVCIARSLRAEPPRGRWTASALTGVLFVGALYANEGALVTIALAPLVAALVARERGLPARAWLGPALPPAALVAVALVWRQQVLGGTGGYAPETVGDLGSIEILGKSIGDLLALRPLTRNLGTAGEVLGVVASVAAALLVVSTLPRGRAREGAPHPLLAPLLLLWIAGYLALFSASRIWFPRQIYLVAAPFALLVASGLRAHATRTDLVRRAAAWTLVATTLAASPVVHGQVKWRASSWARRQSTIAHLVEALDTLEGPARVYTVLPNLRPRSQVAVKNDRNVVIQRSVHQPVDCARLASRGRDLELTDLAYYPLESPEPAFRLEPPGTLVATPGTEFLLRTGAGFEYRGPASPRKLPVDRLPAEARRDVYVYVGELDAGALHRVRSRTQQGGQ